MATAPSSITVQLDLPENLQRVKALELAIASSSETARPTDVTARAGEYLAFLRDTYRPDEVDAWREDARELARLRDAIRGGINGHNVAF